MASSSEAYQVIIIGGGLAGLSLSILLAQKNKRVLVIEKNDYPRHKVCGEYISKESWDFLERLGIPLSELDLPLIDHLKISSSNGSLLSTNLDLGGFGISRYQLELLLYQRAVALGVVVLTNTKYLSYERKESTYIVETTAGIFKSTILCGAFGKYAPKKFFKKNEEKHNWVGVKYHIRFPHPANEIVLHSFDGGYCGMSRIEDGKTCLCYIVQLDKLAAANNDIKKLEETKLCSNPHLNDIFNKATFLFEKPLVISNVTFDVKQPTYDGVFYIGDSAGTIAPLSGNGMSNAFRSAYILQQSLMAYFDNEVTFEKTLQNYRKYWLAAFSSRIKTGRFLQPFFCKKYLNLASVTLLKYAKPIHHYIIRKTHGLPF